MKKYTLEELVKELEKMTPGGSEFHNDPGRCLEFIQERQDTVIKIALERKRLRERVAELEAELQRIKS